jgi:hypothetical protein
MTFTNQEPFCKYTEDLLRAHLFFNPREKLFQQDDTHSPIEQQNSENANPYT